MYSMLYVKYLNFLNPPNKGFFKFLVLHKNVEKTLTVRAGWALDKGTHTHTKLKLETSTFHFLLKEKVVYFLLLFILAEMLIRSSMDRSQAKGRREN